MSEGQDVATNAEFLSLTHAESRHANVLLVDWMLGNRCNFACDYCPKELHDGSIAWVSIEAIQHFLSRVRAHYMDGLGMDVWLQLTGGEPTQFPRFFDLCASAKAHGMRVAVISNGSRTARYWERAAPVLDSAILTYHDLQVDHAVFLRTIRILLAHDVPLHINVTAHPDRFDDVVSSAQDILKVAEGASLTLKPLRVGFGSELYAYSNDQREVLARRLSRPLPRATKSDAEFQRGVMALTTRDGAVRTMRANDLMLEGLNHWKGARCRAGIESLRVNAKGEVRRAVCGVGGNIGHIQDDIAFPMLPIKCDRDTCACVADILISKIVPLNKRKAM